MQHTKPPYWSVTCVASRGELSAREHKHVGHNGCVSITESPSPIPFPASSSVSSDEQNLADERNAPNPYARFDRSEWDRLADRTPLPLKIGRASCRERV